MVSLPSAAVAAVAAAQCIFSDEKMQIQQHVLPDKNQLPTSDNNLDGVTILDVNFDEVFTIAGIYLQNHT